MHVLSTQTYTHKHSQLQTQPCFMQSGQYQFPSVACSIPTQEKWNQSYGHSGLSHCIMFPNSSCWQKQYNCVDEDGPSIVKGTGVSPIVSLFASSSGRMYFTKKSSLGLRDTRKSGCPRTSSIKNSLWGLANKITMTSLSHGSGMRVSCWGVMLHQGLAVNRNLFPSPIWDQCLYTWMDTWLLIAHCHSNHEVRPSGLAPICGYFGFAISPHRSSLKLVCEWAIVCVVSYGSFHLLMTLSKSWYIWRWSTVLHHGLHKAGRVWSLGAFCHSVKFWSCNMTYPIIVPKTGVQLLSFKELGFFCRYGEVGECLFTTSSAPL